MTAPTSLMARLGLSLGIALTALWIAAATVTAILLRGEMDAVFDSALQETAQRLLPLAVMDIVGREDGTAPQRLAAVRDHAEFFTYVVRDPEGRVLLQSHAADAAVFPPYAGPGFGRTATHRLYSEEALQGSIRLTVAEPLVHRAAIARDIQMGLGLPLLVVIPVALLVILATLRASLAPLRRFRARLETRTAADLSPVPADGLPAELAPVAATLDSLFARLRAAFDAERGFAANAAHELRTPLAGAIAQAQRLQAETADPAARGRAAEIEATLKRLTRLSERLMQLARAEGARLRRERSADLRPVARLVVDEIARAAPPGTIGLRLPDRPVPSDLDPDIFGILCRNLIENALRHGSGPVDVSLGADGAFAVANAGPVLDAPTLGRLTGRFERGSAGSGGSGLGLAIVAAIAERIGSRLELVSPRPGAADGVEARLRLPVVPGDPAPSGPAAAG